MNIQLTDNPLLYWFLAAVAAIAIAALVVFFIHLVTREIKAYREAQEYQRRMAYIPRHGVSNEPTVRLQIPAGIGGAQ